eukprot:243273-Pelagomonas_calceolata.AAC.10
MEDEAPASFRLIDCLKKIPQLGACDDQVQSSLNILFSMNKRESPYNVLLILNHAEEVSRGRASEAVQATWINAAIRSQHGAALHVQNICA